MFGLSIVRESEDDNEAASEADSDSVHPRARIHAGRVLVFNLLEYLLAGQVPHNDPARPLEARSVAAVVRNDDVLHVAQL